MPIAGVYMQDEQSGSEVIEPYGLGLENDEEGYRLNVPQGFAYVRGHDG